MPLALSLAAPDITRLSVTRCAPAGLFTLTLGAPSSTVTVADAMAERLPTLSMARASRVCTPPAVWKLKSHAPLSTAVLLPGVAACHAPLSMRYSTPASGLDASSARMVTLLCARHVGGRAARDHGGDVGVDVNVVLVDDVEPGGLVLECVGHLRGAEHGFVDGDFRRCRR